MLTRLKVNGFKNLVDTEMRFGAFTCIAGYNGVGKSNVFDAIRFLSLLADHTFVDAARQVRGGGDLVSLFTAWGDRRMRFECDVVIPSREKMIFISPQRPAILISLTSWSSSSQVKTQARNESS